MSKTVVVRYEARPDAADENQRLVEQVFAELHRDRPEGLRYATFRLDDGVNFVHVAVSDQDESPLQRQPAFARFQRELGERLVSGPMPSPAKLVGSYRFVLEEEPPAAIAVARTFIEAFGKRDLATVGALLADDITFESPRMRLTGAEAVLAAMSEFAGAVTGSSIIDLVGDHDRAMVVYDLQTGPFGTVRAVDHLVVRDGRIVSDTLVFDTHALQP